MNKSKNKKIKIKKIQESKLISHKLRNYIYIAIFFCCCIVIGNLHPQFNNNISTIENYEMTYIFHDYKGNEYILNGQGHGSAESLDFLFDKEIPEGIKGESSYEHNAGDEGGVVIDLSKPYENNIEQYTVTENDNTITIDLGGSRTNGDDKENQENDNKNLDKEENNNGNQKDNQISYEEILDQLGVNDTDNQYTEEDIKQNNSVEIELSEIFDIFSGEDNEYTIKEILSGDESILIIEKTEEESENEEMLDVSYGKTFEKLGNGIVLAILTPREQLTITNGINEYIGNDTYSSLTYQFLSNPRPQTNSSSHISINRDEVDNIYDENITIIDEYNQCMTPWGYKINHGESVLAYEQRADALDICNIERRFCRDGKLSGKYTQQGCSINKNYSYSFDSGDGSTTVNGQRDGEPVSNASNMQMMHTKQPSRTGTGTETEKSYLAETYTSPNPSGADWTRGEDNIKVYESVDQTKRDYPDCVTPRGETVKQGHYIIAFKHANGFSDSPCISQLRLCSVGQLDGNYTEPSCKTRDTSFIDWINGSPTRDTYSEEKIQRVKKIIKAEQVYDVEYKKLTNSDALDRILYTMER